MKRSPGNGGSLGAHPPASQRDWPRTSRVRHPNPPKGRGGAYRAVGGAGGSLITAHTWDVFGADFAEAPEVEGDIPGVPGSTGISYSTGGYSTQAATGAFGEAAIGAARIGRAVDLDAAPGGAEFTFAGDAVTGGVHARLIGEVAAGTGANQRLLWIGEATNGLLLTYLPNNSWQLIHYFNSTVRAVPLIAADTVPDGEVLVDIIARSDPTQNGGANTYVALCVNGVAEEILSASTTWGGLATGTWDIGHQNGGNNMAGSLIFAGLRSTETFTTADHEADAIAAGLS